MIGLLEVYSASSYRLLQADENTKSLLLRQLIFIFLSWIEAPYYASITFQDFIDCVNELFPGGVKIDAEKSLDLDGVYINKGEQVMDGNTLLQYARFREDKEGDFGRIRRQQQVIKAISQQLKDVTSIFKLPKAVGKLLGSIQTNLPESVLLDCGMDFLKDIC